MPRATYLVSAALSVALVLGIVGAASGQNTITITYPEWVNHMTLKQGEIRQIEAHLYNQTKGELTAILEDIGLENLEVSHPAEVKIPQGERAEVNITLSADGFVGEFDGEVHITFETGAEPGGTGAKALPGGTIPIRGEALGVSIITEPTPENEPIQPAENEPEGSENQPETTPDEPSLPGSQRDEGDGLSGLQIMLISYVGIVVLIALLITWRRWSQREG